VSDDWNRSCEWGHAKVYSTKLLLTCPPKQRWICANCGEAGYDVLQRFSYAIETYEEVMKRFKTEEKDCE
jgi:hypothetical protein